jgi:heat-inducible transcriptional repressor
VRDFYAHAHGELELMLARTRRLHTHPTHYTAVVGGPHHHDVATIRSVQLVSLGGRVALLVVVSSDGAIEKRTLELADEPDDARLAAAATRLATAWVGQSLAARSRPAATGDAATDSVVEQAVVALGAPVDHLDHVYVDGASRMAAAFDAIDTVSEVLQILEQQLIVVSLLRDVLDRGLNVAIGAETGIEPLADCSLVVAPSEIDGEPAGSIGVLGPTRMNYPQALAAVAVVSNRLARRLSEG